MCLIRVRLGAALLVGVAVLVSACSAAGTADPLATAVPAPPDPVPSPEPTPTPQPTASPQPTAPPEPTPPRPTPAAPGPEEGACADPLGCWADPQVTGTYPLDVIPEASGLAASRTTPGAWWIVDDGPASAVHLVDAAGSLVGTASLEGFQAVDAEDLAVGPCGPGDPSPCLFVGDTGDNADSRPDVRIARIPEPGPGDTTVSPSVITLTYPDGPVDAEALLVDHDGTPLIVTKSEGATTLHAAPGFADGPTTAVTTIEVPRPARPLLTMFTGLVVTGADAVEDRVLLRTYDHAVEYVAPDPGAPIRDFPAWPHHEVPTPHERQGEAIAWRPDGSGYATVSERGPEVSTVGRP